MPELTGPEADEADAVRDATRHAFAAAAPAATTWVAIGAADRPRSSDDAGPTCVTDVPTSGTFARFGVDVGVSLDPSRGAPPDASAPAEPMPLSMLIAAWLREQAGVAALTPVVIDPEASTAECARIGGEIAAALDSRAQPIGLLVVGDGAFALTPKSPGGGLREESVRLQRRIEAAMAAGDPDALAALDQDECVAEGIGGRVAWQTAAAAVRASARTDDPAGAPALTASVEYADAPFGVGYVVARWQK
ncbi:hypothetical protein ACWDPV_22335 [Gordonia sp. NPDC003504]